MQELRCELKKASDSNEGLQRSLDKEWHKSK